MYTKLVQIMWLLALLYEMSDDDWDHVTLCMGCVRGVWYCTDTFSPSVNHGVLVTGKQALHMIHLEQ